MGLSMPSWTPARFIRQQNEESDKVVSRPLLAPALSVVSLHQSRPNLVTSLFAFSLGALHPVSPYL